MKKTVSILVALSLAVVAWAQNPMERSMEAFPVAKETHILCQEACALLQNNPALAPQMVVEALQGGNRQYANAVLTYADETAGALSKPLRRCILALPTLPRPMSSTGLAGISSPPCRSSWMKALLPRK